MNTSPKINNNKFSSSDSNLLEKGTA
uniref:Uncharacterized protein n=1 Tax=Rhizophora mucronata TaxID=61149 RepID=A0A2P2QVI3_RHIMU